ncbi:MAG: glycosyl transferase family protein [Janthinobacterium lividum]
MTVVREPMPDHPRPGHPQPGAATASGSTAGPAEFAPFVATLGRGPGRSRALTREEARRAFAMVLREEADPHQVGAFMMLLRYRGEDPDEITGLVEACRDVEDLGRRDGMPAVALDWPSYGAGRTRGAPWFLLAALALARAGIPVLMHGTNEFTGGIPVDVALPALGLAPAADRADAWASLRRDRFAYLPISVLAPLVSRMLGMRALFGLRSPVNTVARLLDPADAPASVDGVFHPPYIEVHLAVAERLHRPHLLVLKGGGGEAERPPAKPTAVHAWREGEGRREIMLPAIGPAGPRGEDTTELFAAVWRGEAAPESVVATVTGTIAMALLALGRVEAVDAADSMAREVWKARL